MRKDCDWCCQRHFKCKRELKKREASPWVSIEKPMSAFHLQHPSISVYDHCHLQSRAFSQTHLQTPWSSCRNRCLNQKKDRRYPTPSVVFPFLSLVLSHRQIWVERKPHLKVVTTKLTFHTSLESHLNQSKVVGISYIKEERDFKVVGQQISSRSIFIGETKSNTEPNIFYEE